MSNSNFLIYKDDYEKIKNLISNIKNNNNNEIKEIFSTSNAIKNISPTLIININDEKKTIFPKFNINEENFKNFDINSIKNFIPKFENLNENFNKKNNEINIKNNNENDENNSENNENNSENSENSEYEILEPENIEEDPRLELDKENLLKGFKYGMDPFDMNIKFNKNLDEDDNNKYNIEFKSLEENLEELFDIQLK